MKTLKQARIKNKKVLVRVDFNVPMKDGKITDNSRILAAVPTINFLRKNNAKVILLTHLGRPDGRRNDDYSVKHIIKEVEKVLKTKILFGADCVGPKAKRVIRSLKPKGLALLENVRFYAGEELNSVEFAHELAELGDIYVNDAFGASHRAHASIAGIPDFLPSYAGLLLEKEITQLKRLNKPEHPFIAILGGAKISDKLGVINKLANKCDAILVGGAMMFTFMKSARKEIGKSRYEPQMINHAEELLKTKKIIMPVDCVVASEPKSKSKVVSINKIPKNCSGYDIGPETIKIYEEIIKNAKSVFWNGPLGMAEIKPYDKSTNEIAKSIPKSAFSILGGGDTAAIIKKLKLEKKFSFISTGGGASLEFLEHDLPGIKALR